MPIRSQHYLVGALPSVGVSGPACPVAIEEDEVVVLDCEAESLVGRVKEFARRKGFAGFEGSSQGGSIYLAVVLVSRQGTTCCTSSCTDERMRLTATVVVVMTGQYEMKLLSMN